MDIGVVIGAVLIGLICPPLGFFCLCVLGIGWLFDMMG